MASTDDGPATSFAGPHRTRWRRALVGAGAASALVAVALLLTTPAAHNAHLSRRVHVAKVDTDGECDAFPEPSMIDRSKHGLDFSCTGTRHTVAPGVASVHTAAECAEWCAAAFGTGCCQYGADGCSAWDGVPIARARRRRLRRGHLPEMATMLCGDAPDEQQGGEHDGEQPASVGSKLSGRGSPTAPAAAPAPAAAHVCSAGTCNVCDACCKAYITNGKPCDECVEEQCPKPVCWPKKKCNVCGACCQSYVQEHAACAACVASTPNCEAKPPSKKKKSNCRWRCGGQFSVIPRCRWDCSGPLGH